MLLFVYVLGFFVTMPIAYHELQRDLEYIFMPFFVKFFIAAIVGSLWPLRLMANLIR